uniref:Uncharacterized protein n=1 Tax=uncultured Alphaproteobacteria bacterium TaxID=91750 RepID=A0A6M4NMM4_9PROT|nr:hypothetical protein PlAlph_2210 [uncultured Alphaproteobacteria bacterium]
MVKNKTSFTGKTLKIMAFTLRLTEVATLLAVIGLIFFLWQNPQTVSSWLDIPQAEQPKDNTLLFDNLNQKIENLKLIVEKDNEKAELLNRQFGYFDKSKADTSQIIVLNNKIDTLQNLTEKLSKTSNSGALILTSAMLIRDNVSRGITCQKEAEALKILASGINSMNKDIAFVYNHCSLNFMSAASIAEKFNNIYDEIKIAAEPEVEQDWKKRFAAKVNEYVKISTPQSKNSTPQYDSLAVLGKIKKLVDNGDLAAAAKELDKPENARLTEENEKLKEWYEHTRGQLEFYKSLSNVISNALLIMKVEDTKHVAE